MDPSPSQPGSMRSRSVASSAASGLQLSGAATPPLRTLTPRSSIAQLLSQAEVAPAAHTPDTYPPASPSADNLEVLLSDALASPMQPSVEPTPPSSPSPSAAAALRAAAGGLSNTCSIASPSATVAASPTPPAQSTHHSWRRALWRRRTPSSIPVPPPIAPPLDEHNALSTSPSAQSHTHSSFASLSPAYSDDKRRASPSPKPLEAGEPEPDDGSSSFADCPEPPAGILSPRLPSTHDSLGQAGQDAYATLCRVQRSFSERPTSPKASTIRSPRLGASLRPTSPPPTKHHPHSIPRRNQPHSKARPPIPMSAWNLASPAPSTDPFFSPIPRPGTFPLASSGVQAPDAAYDPPSPSGLVLRGHEEEEGGFSEAVRLAADRLLYQAGVDYAGRPVVVLAAARMPDPDELDLSRVLDRILDKMDLFVEQDYTVVYLAWGGKYSPTWSWLWGAYQRLSRKYRKNLKMLYIVHSTWFTTLLSRMISTGARLISPKFRKKMVQLDRISLLGQHLDLTQVDFPPAVLEHNLKKEAYFLARVFGMRLADAMGPDGRRGLPKVVRDCMAFFYADRTNRMTTHGIFRVGPSQSTLKLAKAVYDGGGTLSLDVDYASDGGILVAALLKNWLRELDSPLFSAALYPLIRGAPIPSFAQNGPGVGGAGDKKYTPPAPGTPQAVRDEARDAAAIAYLRGTLLPAIRPACHAHVLTHIVQLLHDVARHSAQNEMDAYNLATVISPCLVNSNVEKDSKILVGKLPPSHMVSAHSADPFPASSPSAANEHVGATLTMLLRLCIERYYEVFDDVLAPTLPATLPAPTPALTMPAAPSGTATPVAPASGAGPQPVPGSGAAGGSNPAQAMIVPARIPVASGIRGNAHVRTQSQGHATGWHPHTPSSHPCHVHPPTLSGLGHARTPSHSHTPNTHSRSQSQSHSRTSSSVLSSSVGPGSQLSMSGQSAGFFSPLASPVPVPLGPSWGTAVPSSVTTTAAGSTSTPASVWPIRPTSDDLGSNADALRRTSLGSDGHRSGSASSSSSSSRSSPNPVSDTEMHTMASTTTTIGKASPATADQRTASGTPAATPSWPKRQTSFPSVISLAARKASAPSLRAPECEADVPSVSPLLQAPGLARIESEGAESNTPTTSGPPASISGNAHHRIQSVSSSTSTPGRSTPVALGDRRARGASTSMSPGASPGDPQHVPQATLSRPLSPPPVAVGVPSMVSSMDRDTRNALMKADAAFPTVSVAMTTPSSTSGSTSLVSDLVSSDEDLLSMTSNQAHAKTGPSPLSEQDRSLDEAAEILRDEEPAQEGDAVSTAPGPVGLGLAFNPAEKTEAKDEAAKVIPEGDAGTAKESATA